jgi:hypothetical protein
VRLNLIVTLRFAHAQADRVALGVAVLVVDHEQAGVRGVRPA